MAASLRFDRVWKRFRRGQVHDSLRDLVPALVRRLTRRAKLENSVSRDFWALSDVSFDVQPGEVLGIIGPNGAGKSTTLKILNRIMDPTAGAVETNGKIGALIEVSAGFHQDLTGRQNVFLQGAIMGMHKAEVERKFDEIVEFSGVGDFLDTPVKRYSSGMNARLGFSIAAHLEPDILIIDEVLAVGDAEFQKKAFGRIKSMATGGVPVILVSHQLDRIAELCTKAILLERGMVRTSGTAMHCINEYLHGIPGHGRDEDTEHAGIRFERILAPDGLAVYSGEDLSVVVQGVADLDNPPRNWTPAFHIVDSVTGTDLYSVVGANRGIPLPVKGQFEYHVSVQMNLPPGKYIAQAFIWDSETFRHVIAGQRLQVEVLERMHFYGRVQMNARWTAPLPGLPAGASLDAGEDDERQSA
jgi:ABC-type polysaccharide/polyol phosphate transport system ATPase subunit